MLSNHALGQKRICARIVPATGWFAVIYCALIRIGWWLIPEVMRKGLHEFITMKPATATAVTCLGIALLLLNPRRNPLWQRRLGKALALFAICVGTLALIRFCSGWTPSFFALDLWQGSRPAHDGCLGMDGTRHEHLHRYHRTLSFSAELPVAALLPPNRDAFFFCDEHQSFFSGGICL